MKRLAYIGMPLCCSALLGLYGYLQPVRGQEAGTRLHTALQIPRGLDPTDLAIPEDNPITPDKAALGQQLYFDPRLSADGTVACASCHNPGLGFTDGQAVSTGIRGQQGGRSAPTTVNRAFSMTQFWDGRAGSLEEQAKGPLVNPIEMGNPSHAAVVARLKNIPGYREAFKRKVTTLARIRATHTDSHRPFLCYDMLPEAIEPKRLAREVLEGALGLARCAAGKADALRVWRCHLRY